MQYIQKFSDLAATYDGFILDLWGVIHDGQNLYPGASDCLSHLHASGKKIVLLSNAPRRAQVAINNMLLMGMPHHLFDSLITSGEAAYQSLADPKFSFFQPAGNRYFYIGLEKDRGILNGLPYQETEKPEDAHFLLLNHSFYDNQPAEEIEPLLTRCLAVKLSALCINPDMEVVRLNGQHVYCAGVIAAEYEKRGGKVYYFGKPHRTVYDISLKLLEPIKPSRILAVGDNLATDILGANRNGLSSMLVTGGVLKTKVGVPGSKVYMDTCAALCKESHVTADYVIGAFNW